MKIKIKRFHVYKGYASTYNVDILNYLNLELQVENTEPAVKIKLKDLLSELRGFKFLIKLVLGFKKIK